MVIHHYSTWMQIPSSGAKELLLLGAVVTLLKGVFKSERTIESIDWFSKQYTCIYVYTMYLVWRFSESKKNVPTINWLVFPGRIEKNPMIFMGQCMVSCRFSLKSLVAMGGLSRRFKPIPSLYWKAHPLFVGPVLGVGVDSYYPNVNA